jgi:hypothetical protein
MSRRAVTATVVIGLWLAGLAALARRSLFHDTADQLARVGRLVAPATEFYTVTRRGQQIGFASSLLDTTATGIELGELRVTNVRPGNDRLRRATRTTVQLTRDFQMTGFTVRLGNEAAPLVITGTVEGDTALTVVRQYGDDTPRTKQIRITPPLLLATQVPLIIALGHTLEIGQRYDYTVFDPIRQALGETHIRVTADSLFVLSDSAVFDAGAQRWVSAHDTTVRAWRFEEANGGSVDGWFDAGGRIVETRRGRDLTLHRTAYEIAFENWSGRSGNRERAPDAHEDAPHPTTSPALHRP